MPTWTKVVVESSAGNIAQKAATAGVADSITSQGALATLATVDTAQIDASAIETAKINNLAVTVDKIAATTITRAKLNVGGTATDYNYLATIAGGSGLQWQPLPIVDTIADGNANAATSNAVFDAIAALSDSNTTYTTSVVNDAPDVKIRLTGSDSSTDDVSFIGAGGAGDGGLSFTVSGSNITPKVGTGSVSADQLHVTGDGSDGQVLESDGDGSFSWGDKTVAYTDASNSTYWQTAADRNIGRLNSTLTALGHVVVNGNFTVSGTTTTVDTETIKLADNAIELNSNHDASTAPSQDAGITVNRGSSTDQSFYWDESADKWSIGHTETASNVFATTGDVAMIRTGSYVSNQGHVNGFGAIGSLQLNGTSLYVRTD
tara:strand:- start:146 stop:1273 length:1128 start_codon:yes stop_codon:yes gene_type:complete